MGPFSSLSSARSTGRFSPDLVNSGGGSAGNSADRFQPFHQGLENGNSRLAQPRPGSLPAHSGSDKSSPARRPRPPPGNVRSTTVVPRTPAVSSSNPKVWTSRNRLIRGQRGDQEQERKEHSEGDCRCCHGHRAFDRTPDCCTSRRPPLPAMRTPAQVNARMIADDDHQARRTGLTVTVRPSCRSGSWNDPPMIPYGDSPPRS